MKPSRNRLCSIPETGPRAPARTLVAVRAIVPVTQIPPNSADPMLATPCATSSQFDRCRRPVMLSATTAESRLSIPPSNANDSAAGNTAAIFASERSGSAGIGSARGIPPNRDPIVSTGNPASAAATVVSATAIRKPGQCGRSLRSTRMIPIVPAATPTAAVLTLGRAPASAVSLATIGPGSGPASVSPSRSLSWLARMITAIPEVNPTVTG